MSVCGVWVVWYLGVESMKLWFICSKEYERLNNQLGYWNIQFSIWGFMIARYVDFGKMRRYFLFNLFLYFCSPLLSYRKISKVQCCELFWSWKRTILPPSFPPFLPLSFFPGLFWFFNTVKYFCGGSLCLDHCMTPGP